MKKDLFIILVSFLFILVLLYWYDKREIVINQHYSLNSSKIHIEYPYFHHKLIDTYINHYLNQYIDDDSVLFIDYDYLMEHNMIELTIYTYLERDKIVKEKEKKFLVNPATGIIQESIYPKKQEYTYNINTKQSNSSLLALTFDDGPNHNTNKVLDILDKYHIRATFFILGCNIDGQEGIIERMNQLGMEVENHMYSHKLLSKLTDKEIIDEVEKVDTMVHNIINSTPRFVRPSYGSYNLKTKSLIHKPIITWSIDTLDWKYHNSKKIYQRVVNKVHDGDIILMHDIYRATANSLELIIPSLLEKGYQFVTLTELFNKKEVNLENGKVYMRG